MASSDVWAYSNPWLVAACIRWTVEGYQATRTKGGHPNHGLAFPWALAAIALVTTSAVREMLPGNANGKLSILIRDRPAVRALLPAAMRAWAPPFWAGVRLGSSAGVLELADWRLHAKANLSQPIDDHMHLCNASKILGRIIGKEQDDTAIGAAFGIQLGGSL